MEIGIENQAETYLNNKLKSVNLFQVPQTFWLLLFYFLMLNSMLNLLTRGELSSLKRFIPKIFIKYNELIFNYLDVWMPFLGLLSIALFASGMLIGGVKTLPFFSSHGVILYYADYGIHISRWLFISFITYYSYRSMTILFLFTPLLLFLLIEGYRKFKRREFDF